MEEANIINLIETNPSVKVIFDALPSAVIILNKNSEVVYFNRSLVTMFFEKMTVKKLQRIFSHQKIDEVLKFYDATNTLININNFSEILNDSGETFDQFTIENVLENQKYRIILTVVPLLDQNNTPIGIFMNFTNMNDYYDIHDKYDITKEESIKDGLTQIYNKVYVQNYITSEIKKILTDPQYKFSIIMIDIDHFKHINDTYGHLIGDEILKKLSAKIRESIRQNDIPARFGGEEFILVLSQTHLKHALIVAERLRKSMENEDFSSFGIFYPITISLGVYYLDYETLQKNPSVNFEDVIEKADKALYYSKNNGRNQVSVYYQDQILNINDFYKKFNLE